MGKCRAHLRSVDRHARAAWGPVILKARETQGWTQEALAQASGISRRTIGTIENSKSTGHEGSVLKLLKALGLSEPLNRSEPDIDGYVAMLRPLLRQLTVAERAAVMPEVVSLLARAIRPRSTGPAPRVKLDDADRQALAELQGGQGAGDNLETGGAAETNEAG